MKKIWHKTITIPDEVNVFFVGDIHGCNTMLTQALELAGYDKGKDHVVCVGDLIDRGKENLQVLSRFLYNPRFHSVMGNHDWFMADKDVANWVYNGGDWAFDQLDADTIEVLGSEMEERFPVFLTVLHRGNKYGVVHGGIPLKYPESGVTPVVPVWDEVANKEYSRRDIELFMWDRNVITEVSYYMEAKVASEKPSNAMDEIVSRLSDYSTIDVPAVQGVDYVFHWHTGVKNPLRWHNRVWLDTGGVFNGRLTVAVVNTDNTITTFTTEQLDSCGSVEDL